LSELTRDGRLDLVSENQIIISAGVLLTQVTSTFPATATLFSTSINMASSYVAVAEELNDLQPDLIITSTVGTLLNTGSILVAELASTVATMSVYPTHAAFNMPLPASTDVLILQARRVDAEGNRLRVETSGLPPASTPCACDRGPYTGQRFVRY
jgi:hypothetical protein